MAATMPAAARAPEPTGINFVGLVHEHKQEQEQEQEQDVPW